MAASDAFYTTIGIVVSALLTYLGVRYQYSRKERSPAEVLFDAYEAALKDYQTRDELRQNQLNEAWTTINNLQIDLNKARNIIHTQQVEIDKSKGATADLMAELKNFKDNYEKLSAKKSVGLAQSGEVE